MVAIERWSSERDWIRFYNGLTELTERRVHYQAYWVPGFEVKPGAFTFQHSLDGLVVKASVPSAEAQGFNFRPSLTSDTRNIPMLLLWIGNLMAISPEASPYRVQSRALQGSK